MPVDRRKEQKNTLADEDSESSNNNNDNDNVPQEKLGKEGLTFEI